MQFQLRFSEERHRIISVIHYFALPSLILGTAIIFLGGGCCAIFCGTKCFSPLGCA